MKENARTLQIACTDRTKEGLMQDFSEALELEGWFGANFDALHEALSEVSEPTVFELVDWQGADLSPDARETFETVFEDAVAVAGHSRLIFKLIERII